MSWEERRREPRYEVANPHLVEVSIHQADGRVSQSIGAQLSDLSQGGAKLLLSSPLLYDQSAELALRSAEMKLDLLVSAEVCWMRPAGHGTWQLGCSFVPELPIGILEKLFAGGILERRNAKRQPHRLPVTAKWETPAATMPAYVWDYSEGGFCLLSPCKAGRQVTVAAAGTVEDTPTVRGRTQWEVEMAGGFVAGCRFSDEQGYETLQTLRSRDEQRRKPNGERRSSMLSTFRDFVGGFLQRTTPDLELVD